MTTYIYSVTMSLLSRTLQSILSKYILDVDVEGIALPSLLGGSSSSSNSSMNGSGGGGSYSSTSGNYHGSSNGSGGGSGSSSNDAGWGVRLSNVKLREGVQLMVLPGTLPRERKKRTQKKKKKKTTTIQRNHSPTSTSSTHPTQDIPTMPPSDEHGCSQKYMEDTTDHSENRSDAEPTVQTPGGWFSSWFRSTSISAVHHPHNSDQDNVKMLQQQDLVYNNLQDSACMPPSVSTTSNTIYNANDNDLRYPNSNGHIPVDEEKMEDGSSVFYSQDSTDDNQTTSSFAGEDYEDTDDNDRDKIDNSDDDDSADEDHTTNESPLVLKLGRDGTIGILDIRLVGKTIHVLIEDADLTIEVVRQSAQHSGGTDPSNTSQQQQQAAAAAAAAHKKKMASDASSSTAALKTPGDRVLAESIIARYLSIVPNLFLRDVRIRLIIRGDEPVVPSHPHDTFNTEHGVETNDFSNDSVVEVVIGLFSVNDGKDFLLNFAGEVENEVDDDDEEGTSSSEDDDDDIDISAAQGRNGNGTAAPASDGLRSSSGDMTTATASTNEFLTKRIRTGRGPEGGIVVRIYPATYNEIYCGTTSASTSNGSTANMRWARDTWNSSTEFVLVRCSGLDALAQIFLGTKKEIAIQNYGYYSEEIQYDNFTVDAMLFGVDYIVPGPQPPLPKISHAQQVLPNPLDAEVWANTGSTTFVADTNGIQSCRIASPFHKVARGFIPFHCMGTHLPNEPCHHCWTKEGGASSPHMLDASTPLGGFIVHVSVRDPLDINVDRYNLTVLGRLIRVFTKQKINARNTSKEDGDQNSTSGIPVGSNHSMKSHSSMSNTISTSYQSIDDSVRSTVSGRRVSKTQSMKKLDEGTIKAAFPAYMKPEKIQMAGLHIADVHFRVHILKRNRNLEYGRSYCYWDVCAKCATLDFQNLSAPERPFQDIRLEIAHLTVHQLKGVDRKQIISLGIRPQTVDFDDATVDTLNNQRNRTGTPWPTTAATILDIMPPLESMIYADREYHGLQLRYLAVLDPLESINRSRKDLNIRVGTALVDVEFQIKDEIVIVVSEAVASVIGPPKGHSTSTNATKPLDSILKYKVMSDGGRIDLKPLISATLPRTISQGEISKRAGFSVESFLDQFRVAYRNPSSIRVLDQGLSLQQLATLPDNVRLRVLLFLKDLKPLESALGLPDTPNSFLRCRAVNNGIVKMAERRSSMNVSTNEFGDSRRQILIGELLALDDDTLDNLLLVHRRRKEKSILLNGK